ncbi:MAG TPA: hypothetical protein VEY11_10305 [Pyrinomonadaceae bacterium]|nr:hypothetical protein [Pyrinomonadaceae bacterium]
MGADRKINGGKDAGGVVLRATSPINDYLLYKVTVSGAQPHFTLVERGRPLPLLEAPPPVQKTYQRKWPIAGTDQVSKGDMFEHNLGMAFLKAVKYRYVIEHYDDGDNLIAVLKDVEWSSQNPTSMAFEPFVISVR